MIRTYTLNEIVDALHAIRKEEDSIKALLKGGDFRERFDGHVALLRTKRTMGELTTLQDRLVSINYNGEDVYVLDDLQEVLSKKQFAVFMKFLQTQDVNLEGEGTTYIPTKLIDLFVQDEEKPTLKDTTTVVDPRAVITVKDAADDVTVLKFS